MLHSLPRGADAVIALGGGTLVRTRNQATVRALGTVAWLDCPLDEALARCGPGTARPLLRDRKAAERSLVARLPGYRRAHCRVVSAGRSAEQVAGAILARLDADEDMP